MTTPDLPEFDAMWDFKNPLETEGRFRQLLPAAEQDVSYHAELLTQIARAEGLQRKFDQAHATLDEADKLIQDERLRPMVRLLLERGRAFNSNNNKSEAKPLFLNAWELAKELGEDGLAVDAAHMIAIVEEGEESLRWNFLALGIVMSSPQPAAKKWRKSLHNNIGWTYHDAGQFEEALHQFELSRVAAETMGDPESERIARWSIAHTLRSLGKFEEALAMQMAQIAEHRHDKYVVQEVAECLVALGRTDEAKPFQDEFEAMRHQ